MRNISLILSAALLFSGCCLFVPSYKLTVNVLDDAGGTVSAEPQGGVYPENTKVTLTAVPDENWEVASWQGAISGADGSASVVMDMDRTVTVVFQPELVRSNPSDGLISPPAAAFAPSAGDSWTFMVYLDADNNLDAAAALDFIEMQAGAAASGNGNFSIIVLYDRWGDGALEGGDIEAGTRLYKIDRSGTSELSSPALGLTAGTASELNMGDPDTLRDFISYCGAEHPAEHYALMLWNHGGGAKSLPVSSGKAGDLGRHVCMDETSSDILYNNEIQTALAAAVPNGIDVISMDACLMGTVETAYELRNHCEYYTASMSNVNSAGWNYEDLFGRMATGSGPADAASLAVLMVDSFRREYADYPSESISSVRTAGLEPLKLRIDDLASALYSAEQQVVIERIRDDCCDFFNDGSEDEVLEWPYHDLADFCYLLISNEKYLSAEVSAASGAVLGALGACVESAFAGAALGGYYGTGAELRRGLSIFFSKGNLKSGSGLSYYASQGWYTDLTFSNRSYGGLDFCTSDDDGEVESWRELMEAWYDPFRPQGYTPGCW